MTRALAAAVAVCLALGAASPAAAQRRIHLWHAYDSAEQAALSEAVDAFRAQHPDIHVTVLKVPFGAYATKLEQAIPVGEGPDVFIDAHERLGTYAAAGLLSRLGDVGPLAHDFEPAHLSALELDGELYGLPMAIKCAALYVNEALLPAPPATLEALAAARLPDGVFPLVFESDNAYYVAALVHAYGGELLDAQGRYAFSGEAAERAVAHLLALQQAGVIPEEVDGNKVKTLFGSGRAAAAISGPWLAPGLPPRDELRWTVVPLPRVEAAGRAMEPYATVEAAFVSARSTDPEAARQLAAFLAGAEGARIRALAARQVVASRSAWDDPALSGDAFLSTFRRAAAAARPMPTHASMRLVFEPAQRALRKVLRGDMPPDVALREGQRRFDDVVRPQPAPRDPTPMIVLLGLLLLVGTVWAVRRVSDPTLRAAIRASVPAYKYVAHAFVAVGLLVVAPLAVGGAAAFFGGRGTDLHYVGLANFVDIVTARGGDPFATGSFWLVLAVTVLWTALNLLLHVSIGVALAMLLHRPLLRLKAVYRVLLILPWAVPSYVTALAWRGMFDKQLGAINALLDAIGVEPVSWFAQWSTAFGANVATNTWLGFPFMMVVTLGALTAIPGELYEAAEVDGASAWQRFRLITLPLLKPMLAPAMAMGAVWTFNMFNVVFLVSRGEPDGTTEILVSEAYRWAFTRGHQYGYAAAYAVLIFAILLLGSLRFSRGLSGDGARR